MMRVWLFALLVLATTLSFLPRAHAATYVYPDGNRYSSPQAYCDTLAGQWVPSIVTTTVSIGSLISGNCYNSGNTMTGGWFYNTNSASQTCTAGLTADSGTYDIGTTYGTGAPPLNVCKSGCNATFSGNAADQRALVGGVYHYYASGVYVTDGTECTSGPAPAPNGPPPADTCGTGQAMGQVNGKNVCVNTTDGTAANPNATPTSAPNTQPNVTNTTTNNTTTTTNNTTGAQTSYTSYSTQTTTTTNNNGNGNGNGNGNNAPPCDPFNPTAGCAPLGSATDSVMPTKTVNVAITPVAVGGVGYCPASLPFTVAGRQGALDFTTYCNYANAVRPLILAFAWLTAAGLLIGGFRTEG